MKLNVGCGRNIKDGWTNIDSAPLPGVVVVDLERVSEWGMGIPIDDNQVEEFLLSHVIEHIHNTLPLMEELYRVAKPGAQMEIRVPYGSSDDAWEDPTHVRAYFLDSWGYFSQPYYWRADYGYRGDWKPVEVQLAVRPSLRGVHKDKIIEAITLYRNVVSEMVCTLEAVKPAREPLRELQQPAKTSIVLA